MKTIVALATAPLNCAIHIIRLSGDEAFKIINRISKQKITKKGYSMQRAFLYDNNQLLDDVIIAKYVAPKSYTGQDLIEINCHGGNFVANKIISSLIKNGAILAKRGEFTYRALLNNKVNLINVNGIKNIISSTNDLSLSIAHNNLNNSLYDKITSYRNVLFDLIGKIEVNIDYPEYEDIEIVTNKKLISQVSKIKTDLENLLNKSNIALKVNNGIKIAIVGKPNVGKSSLLNKILGYEKAIISNIPGTTRDLVEGQINFKDITFNFIDTAGIRNKANFLEKQGIEKSWQVIKAADFVIILIDSSKSTSNQEKQMIAKVNNLKDNIVVLNKSDLKLKTNLQGLKFSVKKDNVEIILDKIYSKICSENFIKSDKILFQEQYQIDILKQIISDFSFTLKRAKKSESLDLLISYLHNDLLLLDKLLGKSNDSSFLNELFSKFCIGK